MTYTQMLFALAFDKLVFGHSPGWTSILGSSLILGPAIFVAMQKNVDETKGGQNHAERDEDDDGDVDVEAQRALLIEEEREGEGDEVDGEGRRMPVPEVQMRALR